jgi:hypothetical protein
MQKALDRAHGRPPQAIALRAAGDNYDFDRLTDEQLLLLEELLTIALVSGPYEPAVVEGELLPAP